MPPGYIRIIVPGTDTQATRTGRELYKVMNKKKSCLLLLLSRVGMIAVSAQEKITITGIITSDAGLTARGALITARGIPVQAYSDSLGRYAIIVPGDETLVFSLEGHETREVAVDGRQVIDVQLPEARCVLEEVVVVGYGTRKKIHLTGAISSIPGEILAGRPVISTSAALQGIAPGVTITARSGAPGGDGGIIRVRGISDFGGASADPLILVDGVEGDLDRVDASIIESVNILKDAASAAIYGARAANGVILVTTRRGGREPLGTSKNSTFPCP